MKQSVNYVRTRDSNSQQDQVICGPRKLSEALGVSGQFSELNRFGNSKRFVNRI